MKKICLFLACFLPAVGFADAKQKATTVCAACHGANGISSSPLWPNLAGQKKDYLAKQLKDFKAGTRKDPVMEPQAKQLADAEIEILL